MNGKLFVDTNILIYAHDVEAGTKYRIANELLRDLWAERRGVLSMQVLQEFYVNAVAKIRRPLSKSTARRVINDYARWCIETTSAEIVAAFQIEDENRIGFWDALIVAAAVKSGAERIVSEDFSDGQRVAGVLIENPFVGKAGKRR